MESRSDMNQQQTPVVKKINHITGRTTKTKGSGLRGVIILYAQHSQRLIWNMEPGFQVTPPRSDVARLERIQKAATMMVSWFEDTKSKEKLRGAGLFHLKATGSLGQHNLI